LIGTRKARIGDWFFGRPDWDITTPELREAWEQGRKELFCPYGKTYAQTLGEQD
jgi:hypothetical protein